jgi:hypothetical protein
MKLFNKPFGEYWQFAKVGVYLLALVSIIRFLMKPVFNIPYGQGTHFTSVTILMILLIIYYAVRANAAGYDYRDLLGIAAAIAWPTTIMIILGIAIDDFGGIDTYYTDLEHGGSFNPWQHMGGHIIFSGIITPLVLWGIGALVYYLTNANRKKAVA